MRRKPVLKVGTWIHIALRILLLLSGVTLLVLAVYMAVRWGPIRSQKIYPAVLAAVRSHQSWEYNKKLGL
jgi:hypothetical protein